MSLLNSFALVSVSSRDGGKVIRQTKCCQFYLYIFLKFTATEQYLFTLQELGKDIIAVMSILCFKATSDNRYID